VYFQIAHLGVGRERSGCARIREQLDELECREPARIELDAPGVRCGGLGGREAQRQRIRAGARASGRSGRRTVARVAAGCEDVVAAFDRHAEIHGEVDATVVRARG
jgi:hypothetical protein